MKYIKQYLFLFFSIILFSYTIYKSEFYWDGSSRSDYIIYYVASFLLLFYFFLTFFLKKIINEKIFLVFISILFSLYLIEISISIKKYLIDKDEVSIEHKDKTEKYNELKKKNPKVSFAIPPGHFTTKKTKLFPLSGLSYSKTINCNENGFYSIFESDRYGFNNPDIDWNSEEIEYLLVGDSFTFGDCVNRPNDMASVLRQLSGKSVLNLGYRSNGPLIELATLKEYLRPNVKNVVWFFYRNDIENLSQGYKNLILRRYIDESNFTQNLVNKQNQIDDLILNTIEEEINKKYITKFKISKFIKLSEIRYLLRLYFNNKRKENIIYNAKNIDLFTNIIEQALIYTLKNDTKLYFAYIPDKNIETNEYNPDIHLYKQIKEIVTDLKIPFIDLYDEIFLNDQRNNIEIAYFQNIYHFNEEEYYKASKAVFEFIKKDFSKKK